MCSIFRLPMPMGLTSELFWYYCTTIPLDVSATRMAHFNDVTSVPLARAHEDGLLDGQRARTGGHLGSPTRLHIPVLCHVSHHSRNK